MELSDLILLLLGHQDGTEDFIDQTFSAVKDVWIGREKEHSSIGITTYTYELNSKLISIIHLDGTVVPFTQDALSSTLPPADHEEKSANIPYSPAGEQTEDYGAESDEVFSNLLCGYQICELWSDIALRMDL